LIGTIRGFLIRAGVTTFLIGVIFGAINETGERGSLVIAIPWLWLAVAAMPIRWVLILWRLPLRTAMVFFPVGWTIIWSLFLLGYAFGMGDHTRGLLPHALKAWASVLLPGIFVLAIEHHRSSEEGIWRLCARLSVFRLRHLLIVVVILAVLLATARMNRGYDSEDWYWLSTSSRSMEFYRKGQEVIDGWITKEGYTRSNFEKHIVGTLTHATYGRAMPDGTKVLVYVRTYLEGIHMHVEVQVPRRVFPMRSTQEIEADRIGTRLMERWKDYEKANAGP